MVSTFGGGGGEISVLGWAKTHWQKWTATDACKTEPTLGDALALQTLTLWQCNTIRGSSYYMDSKSR